ncbi:helix-turn-helix domain-containing protein [Luteimonas sp. A277]
MTNAIRSANESSGLTRSFERIGEGVSLKTSSAQESCQVFKFGDYVTTEASTPVRHTAIGDLVAKWEETPDRRAAIARARAWVADAFHADEGETLRTLRMKKGFSQQQLAVLVGTSQPHIARIEGGADNLAIDTCRRLSHALGVDLNTLDAALLQQRPETGAKSG